MKLERLGDIAKNLDNKAADLFIDLDGATGGSGGPILRSSGCVAGIFRAIDFITTESGENYYAPSSAIALKSDWIKEIIKLSEESKKKKSKISTNK